MPFEDTAVSRSIIILRRIFDNMNGLVERADKGVGSNANIARQNMNENITRAGAPLELDSSVNTLT